MFDRKLLIREALKAREFSYCKYSGFAVGAALLCKNQKIFRGCNVENAAYGPTNCAERTAVFKAVSEGEKEFEAIAIVGAPSGDKITGFAYPCGVCRQVLSEFCDLKEFKVIVAVSEDEYKEFSLEEVFPYSFQL